MAAGLRHHRVLRGRRRTRHALGLLRDARLVFASAKPFARVHEILREWPHRHLVRTLFDARTVNCVLTCDPKFEAAVGCFAHEGGVRRCDGQPADSPTPDPETPRGWADRCTLASGRISRARFDAASDPVLIVATAPDARDTSANRNASGHLCCGAPDRVSWRRRPRPGHRGLASPAHQTPLHLTRYFDASWLEATDDFNPFN